jgi:cold shock CspA family protein
LQTVVKKWFRDKGTGYLDNGNGPDILVLKADLSNCDFLKVGVEVEFECGINKRGLIAKNVKLIKKSTQRKPKSDKPFRFGVMK